MAIMYLNNLRCSAFISNPEDGEMSKICRHRAARTLSPWECVNTHRLELAKHWNGVRAHGPLVLGAH